MEWNKLIALKIQGKHSYDHKMVEKSKGCLSAHTIIGSQVQDFNVQYWMFIFPKIMADTLKA